MNQNSKAQQKNAAKNARLLELARLRLEKCEFAEAREAYESALATAKRTGDVALKMEAISGLLRLASEALDTAEIKRWDVELDALVKANPRRVPPMVWYFKGTIAAQRGDNLLAQRLFHRYLRAVRAETPLNEEGVVRGWVVLARALWTRGRNRRAEWLAKETLRRYGERSYRGMNGILYLVLGSVAERARRYDEALRWFQSAHTAFLSEHNWHYHLYVIYAYARIARLKQDYAQAYWYLDMLDKAATGAGFGQLRREIEAERRRLEDGAIDLLIDERQGVVRTRAGEDIALGKQYVLMGILEALSEAHENQGGESDRGLSKAEIIEQVWHESYRPEAHDNKLYYNINRLRKLIEPDMRKPQYLLNWKEGYRLAPGLRVHVVGARERKGEGK